MYWLINIEKYLFQNLIFFVVSEDTLWCAENIIPLGKDIYLASHVDKDSNETYPKSVGKMAAGCFNLEILAFQKIRAYFFQE